MEENIHIDDIEVFHLGADRTERTEDFMIEQDEDSITVEAVEDALYPVQEFIDQKLLRFGYFGRDVHMIRLAVEEVFINICSYAYQSSIGTAKISCRLDGDVSNLILRFADSGIPFNPLEQAEADTSGVQFMEREGGFGIHLVKKIMDKISYEYKDGKNYLVLEKKLRT